MSLDLFQRSSIESALFVKWTIPEFETAYLSDYNRTVIVEGNTYTNIGKLMSISAVTSELKASPSELSIGLSGIPTNSISDVLNRQIKGSNIEIRRAFFDPITQNQIANVLKFKGIVTNYDVSDDVDVAAQIATTTITLTCSSIVEVLGVKVSGRRTNPVDFPGELSMGRVQALANSNFNFGAPK